MKCRKCGAWTTVLATRKVDGWTNKRTRICGEMHRTVTYEVTSAVWGKVREVNTQASKAAQNRAAVRARNKVIVRKLKDGVKSEELEQEFKLSKSSISLIKRNNERNNHA